MTKQEFNKIVNEGLARGKNFMCIKMVSKKDINPRVLITQGGDIAATVKNILKITDKDMICKDNGDVIEDVLLTSNLNDLSWFVY